MRTLATIGVVGGALTMNAAACEPPRPPPSAPLPEPVGTSATVGPSAAELQTPTTPSGTGAITGWLRTEGNHIVGPDGRPFHGRGANVHDTRSCDSCAWEPPHVEEVTRRIDELVDVWHANFLRLLLESYPDDGSSRNGGNRRKHYKDILDDDDYFRDVMRIVGHVGKKRGVYVLVSLWQDPSFSPLGWPTERTRAIWRKLAGALRDMPYVMFGLVNEPQKNDDGKRDAEVWTAMDQTVAAIRAVENPQHPHVVTVQGTREWGRSLTYYVEHPIRAGGGVNVAYETHVYNHPTRFDELVGRPARTLPVVIGEFGAQQDKNVDMTADDCDALMALAENLEVPWLAWSFHTECPPNLLVEHKGACGVGVSLAPSPWGARVKRRLAQPW